MIALSFLLSLSACLLWTGTEGQSSGQLRLVARNGQTSSSLTAGRLEVYYNGQWGTVCDDEFFSTEADVACRQLGFSDNLYNTNVGFTSSSFATRFTQASSSTPIWFDSLSCSSSDSRLIDCASSIGVHNCAHNEDVVLFCQGDGAVRLSTSFSTSTTFTSLTSSAGRVEIYYDGEWGTVCDDGFGRTDADVVCQQLGYPSSSTFGSVGSLGYSQGSGTIWLTNLGCTSSDLMLSTCSSSGFRNAIGCFHSEDVAVSCNTLNSDFTSSIAGAVIAGIVIAVLVPLCCIGICVTIIVIAVCTGACAAGAASSRGRRRNVNVAAATIPPPVATATVVTSTGAAVSAPPPYTSAAYPTQPQPQGGAPAAYPTQPQPQGGAPAAYPQQPGYPPQAGGAGYSPYPAQPPPAAYPPQQPPADEQKVELQQYPADPAYPPQPYPAAGYPPPTNQ